VRCGAGYRCPRGGYAVMAVSAFVANSTVRYRGTARCDADCETECVRRADCVGFTSDLVLLGSGGLTVRGSARCGPAAVPCATTQMQFFLPAPCDEATPDSVRLESHAAVVSSTLANCTIDVSARATRADAYFSVPHIASQTAKSRGSLAILFGLFGAVVLVSAGVFAILRFNGSQ
jgi:hypothetical protein